jgi:hypothetical protein
VRRGKGFHFLADIGGGVRVPAIYVAFSYDAAFSRDGTLLASASNTTIRISDA